MTGMTDLPLAEIFVESDFTETQQLNVAKWDVVAFTHACPGRTTPSEDSAACFQLPDGTGVLVVADGVGGHQSGEVASAIAVRSIHHRLRSRASGTSLRASILDAIDDANQAILDLGIGAATTIAVVELNPSWIRPYHVGDSLITLLSQRGRVKWQAIGHAPVTYAIEAGVIDEEEAMGHPERHLVSNVVGQEDMTISIGPKLQPGVRDTLVLCSDGLSDNVSTEELAELIRAGSLQPACEEVVRIAQTRMASPGELQDVTGKPDDLTILACRMSAPDKS